MLTRPDTFSEIAWEKLPENEKKLVYKDDLFFQVEVQSLLPEWILNRFDEESDKNVDKKIDVLEGLLAGKSIDELDPDLSIFELFERDKYGKILNQIYD